MRKFIVIYTINAIIKTKRTA